MLEGRVERRGGHPEPLGSSRNGRGYSGAMGRPPGASPKVPGWAIDEAEGATSLGARPVHYQVRRGMLYRGSATMEKKCGRN